MSDELAPLFESRETRLGRLPEETRTRFAEAETAALSAGNTDFADKQFVSFWLSRRTGLPRRDVLTSFDALSKRYFGEGATAATAYDSISKGYQPTGDGEKVPETKQGGGAEAIYAEVEGLPKAGKQSMMVNVEQSARIMPSGAAETLWGAVGGFYSQAATVASAPGRAKSAFEDRTYLELSKERAQILRPPFWPYDYDKQPNERESKRLAKIDADMVVLKGRNESANLERLKAFADSDSKEVSKEFRRLADTAYGIAKVADEAFGVDPEFANTTLGSFMKSAGSVPATAAIAAMGPGGWVGMESMFFGQVEQERMEKEGVAYDPEKAAAGNLASAIPQAIMERAFGVERIMNKVLGDLPKMQGRVSFGDFAKGFVRNGLAAGIEEGITEPAQGFWNDFMASLTYDQSRELFTEEKAKERLVESVSGFALGFLFGGGIAGVQALEQNRSVAAGERYLTTKEGEMLAPEDFRVMRDVKTDMELLATAPDAETGKILVAAANGDVKAQKDYNNRVMAALFVKTEDVDVDGISVGVVNDNPVVKLADGMIEPLDMTNEAHRTFLSEFKRRAVQVVATRDTLAELQKRHGDGLEVSQPTKLATLEERVASGQLTQEQADDALEVAKTINGLAADLKLSDIAPEGSAATRQDGDVFKMVVEVAQSANPTVAIEEVSEAYIQRAYKAKNLVPADLQAARVRWMEQNGETDAAAGFEGDKLDRANIEWFSKRVIDYALANRKTELPGGWGAWLRTLGEQLKKFLAGATRMKKLMRDGKLDPELEAWMKGAIGKPGDAFGMASERANAQAAQGNAEAAPVADEVEQEMMETAMGDESFPKIERTEAGGDFLVSAPDGRYLGSRPTIEEAQQMAVDWFEQNARAEDRQAATGEAGETKANELMTVILKYGLPTPSMEPTFAGELRTIRENMGTAKALRVFRKKAGELDMIRQAVNEEGFQFETVTDFLAALDRSSRGEPVYGNRGSDEQMTTFSLGTDKEGGPVFYSRLIRTVEQAGQNKATGAQWKGTIRNSKLGANADEMALVGVNDLEDGKTYTKAEVLDYLRANEVKVEDVTLGEGEVSEVPEFKQDAYADSDDYKTGIGWSIPFKDGDEYGYYIVRQRSEKEGGEFYTIRSMHSAGAQEDYMTDHATLEEAQKSILEDDDIRPTLFDWNRAFSRGEQQSEASQTHFSTYQLPGAVEGSYREVLLTVPELAKQPHGSERAPQYWRDGHSQYSEHTNPIVRLRYNERTTADGKRMLFLEEVQAPQKAEFEKMPALFQKNWREIGFKWALRKAADEGFEVLGWTSGEQQAERYDLSKQVSEISYAEVKQDVGVKERGFYLSAVREDGGRVAGMDGDFFSESKLEEAVGKEIARKILAGEGRARGTESSRDYVIDGEGLKVGGEGLRKLYDSDFRNVVNGLPVVKKSGQKVGTAEINQAPHGTDEQTGRNWVEDPEEPGRLTLGDTSTPSATVHALTLTPDMNAAVRQGQTTFSLAPIAGKPSSRIDFERLNDLGFTTDIQEAGYMAPDGKMIDLSGKREGGRRGARSYDHREAGGTRGMMELQNMGFIRMQPESGGLDMVQKPTPSQEAGIRRYVEHFDGAVVIDLQEGIGEYVESGDNAGYTGAKRRSYLQFMEGTKAVKVLGMIRRFYAGEDVSGMTFSLEDITFATTGVPQNAQQSLQAQLQAIRAQRLAATGDLIVYRKKNPHAPQHTTAAIRSFESGVISKWMLPVSERLRYLGKTMAAMARLRRYEFDLGRNIIADYKMVKPLLTGMGQMKTNDAELFGFAISNGDTVTRDRLLAAYNLGNAWAQYEAMRDGLRARALAAGMDVGYIEDYFPRWLKDRDGHRAFYNKKALGSRMDEALEKAQKEAGRVLTIEEENEIINNLIVGRRFGDGKPSNTKARTIETIEAGAWQFYAPPSEALLRQLEQFEQSIAKRHFFGKEVKMLPSISAHAPSQIDVTNSIGAIANEMRRNGEIDAEGFEELVNVLDARFNAKLGDVSLLSHWGPTLKTMTSARTYMNLTYMVTMGRLSSALSQIPDLMISIYEAGPIDALAAVGKAAVENIGELPIIGNKESWREGVGKAVRSGKSVTTEKLGIDRIAAEFKDIRKTALALDQVFRLTGLQFMDRVGKQTLINAKTNQLRRQAKSGKFSAKNRAMLDNIFGKQVAQKVIADFAAGKETDDTLFAAYNVLADYQPISLSEYPEVYLKHPTSRILYMLKSYTIKQLSAFRRESFMLMWHGNAKQTAVGARNLMHLSALLMLAGVGTDWLKDWFMERDPQMHDLVVDNLFKLMGWNRWAVWRFRTRKKETTGMDDVSMIAGVLGAATQVGMDVIGPPLIWRYITDDIREYARAMARGDDYNMADAASFQLIPVVGDQWYWREGGGKKKTEKRKAQREKENP